MVMGNAGEVDLREIEKEFSEILIDGEILERAFCVVRDKWVFTNKRLILLDIQGVTGAKREYHSIPYKEISHFGVETAGTLDDDCEMTICIRGGGAIKKEFTRKTNIKELQRLLAKHVL